MIVNETQNLPRVVLILRACILNTDGQILLVKRSKYDRYEPEKWEFPGGKLKTFQDPYEALYEEVEQETNLIINIKEKLVYFDGHLNDDTGPYNETPYAVIVIVCSLEKDREIILSHEHEEFIWVSPQMALEMDIKEEERKAITTFISKKLL